MESPKKSNQKFIECNMINMNCRNSCENILPKNSSYSIFNTLNEPKIKLESNYRNTNYKFYAKRNNFTNFWSINKEK